MQRRTVGRERPIYPYGLSPESSHPVFVSLAPHAFYEESNELAPFGNDSGHDALTTLQTWYLEGGQDEDVAALLGRWCSAPPGLWTAESDVARAWAETAPTDTDHLVTDAAQTAVGVALGQLKIRGHVTAEVRRAGWQAVTLHRVLLERAARDYPEREHAAAAARSVDAIARVLGLAPAAPTR